MQFGAVFSAQHSGVCFFFLFFYTLLNFSYQVDEEDAYLETYDSRDEGVNENDISVHSLQSETNFPYGFKDESETELREVQGQDCTIIAGEDLER